MAHAIANAYITNRNGGLAHTYLKQKKPERGDYMYFINTPKYIEEHVTLERLPHV